jgi:hypothetical protein
VNAIRKQELEPGLAEMPPVNHELKRSLNERVLDNHNAVAGTEEKQLAPLFLPDIAKAFRSRWDTVQRGFVDDPRQAVRQGDELVGQVMKSLAETFSTERATFESQPDQTDKTSTESLRIALRRHRSFFERLLSL